MCVLDMRCESAGQVADKRPWKTDSSRSHRCARNFVRISLECEVYVDENSERQVVPPVCVNRRNRPGAARAPRSRRSSTHQPISEAATAFLNGASREAARSMTSRASRAGSVPFV